MYLLRTHDNFLEIRPTTRSAVEGTIILSVLTFPRPPRPIETETHLSSLLLNEELFGERA